MNRFGLSWLMSVCAFVAMLAGVCFAQIAVGGKANVQTNSSVEWVYISSPHFNIHYANNLNNLADLTARYAEASFDELTNYLDYKPATRFQLFTYPNQNQYVNAHTGEEIYTISTQKDRKENVYFNGNQADYYALIKKKVALMMLVDMFFYTGTQKSIQNRLLLHVPHWFITGLAEYLGEGWTYQDEMIMRSLPNENLTKMLLETTEDKKHTVVRKSLWRLIAQKSMKSKALAEIAYMTRLHRSVDGGFQSVLSLSPKSFTYKWLDYCKTTFVDGRTMLEKRYKNLPLINQKTNICGASLSPDKSKIAYIAEKEGVYKVFIYNLTTNKKTFTTIQNGYQTDEPEALAIQAPITWNNKGTAFAAFLPNNSKQNLYYYNLQENTLAIVDLSDQVHFINHLNWSPDDKLLAISASYSGQTDLYIANPMSDRLQRLTFDKFDDLYPAWSPTGKTIFFSSNRDSVLQPTGGQYDYNSFRKKIDLYAIPYPLTATDKINRITNTSFTNEYQTQSTDSGLFFLSDESGIPNFYQMLGTQSGTTHVVTDFAEGILNGNIARKNLLLTTYKNGKLQPYLSDSLFIAGYSTARKTQLAEQNWQLSSPQPITPNNPLENPIKITLPDSIKTTIRYYIFDDEDSIPRPRKKRANQNNNLEKNTPTPNPNPFNINTLKIFPQRKQLFGFNLEQLSLDIITFHPFLRWGTEMAVRISDAQVNHRLSGSFTPFLDFKSTFLTVQYEYLKNKIDYTANFQKTTYFFTEPQPYRYNTLRFNALLSYPFNRFQSIGIQGSALFINKDDLRITDITQQDGKDQLTGFQFFYNLNNTKTDGNLTTKGTRAQFLASTYYQSTTQSINYSSLTLDLRKYIPVKNLVFVLRFNGGFSFGTNTQTYAIGGIPNSFQIDVASKDNLPIEKETPDFYFTNFIMPIRAFNYNARSGSKFGVINMELRFPLKKIFNKTINTVSLNNLQWIVFYDIGTAWRVGNPFSQKNPIDQTFINNYPLLITVQTLKSPFIFAYGTGIRTMILGYHIRADAAWGIDDGTTKKPVFNLSLGYDF